MKNVAELEDRIGHRFSDPSLLTQAITHPSLAYETQRDHADNQRLEFLGDAVLQLVFTDYLFRTFPHFSEGILTKLRSRLVSRAALQNCARRLGLGDHVRMGRGEESSGGRERAGTLSDAFEALLGAVYLDAGLEAVRQVILRVCADDIAQIEVEPSEVNPKGQLQEILQAHAAGSPRYSIISEEGPDHCKRFVARVEWNGRALGTGSGNSKKEAETAAAAAALCSADLPGHPPP